MQPVVVVKHVTKTFKLPHERHSSLKSVIVNFYRRRKSYETQVALKDVSFEVQKGDFFAIVGRNGSGKSTLLKLLAGIYTPTKGHVAVDGRLTPFIELGVGFNPDLTGRENVFLNGALLGFTRKEMEAKYNDIVAFAELERFMDQKLKNYSSGMQVRLAFSIAIRAKGDILLLDEVLAVGDGAFQQKCYDYFEELKAQRKTVIFVSHDMGAVRRFCNKAIYMREGKLIGQGEPADIAEQYELDNMERTKGEQVDDDGFSKLHSVEAKIKNRTSDGLSYEISYHSEEADDMYVGIAILKNGVSIAELITPPDMKLAGSGKVSYRLDTTVFNAGVYTLAVALFRLRNRELIAIGKKKNQFQLTGSDYTRGGALKLADTWKQV
jgi:ABC-2 type transport system ATP-binding protein